MIRLFPAVQPAVRSPLESVLGQALAAGSPPPAWVAVEDDSDLWVREAAAVPRSERARGVFAARSEVGLVMAVRLGIGGALLLPPSTTAARAALEAAAALGEGGWPDPGLADLVVADASGLVAVGWARSEFWRCQLGEPEMAAWLADLAVELGVLPAVVPWPAMVIGERSTEQLVGAWHRVEARRGIVSDGIVVVRVEPAADHGGRAVAAIRGLVESDAEGSTHLGDDVPVRPVYELPSGRHVGWWSSSPSSPEADREWTATPAERTAAGFRWKLAHPNGSESTVDDVLRSDEVGPPAARLPGWVGVAIGAGRPAGLLLERLAAAAAERGVPLWVPNVDHAALNLVLRQPGTIWVDGPAAPSAEP
jgi:hypothetical protein